MNGDPFETEQQSMAGGTRILYKIIIYSMTGDINLLSAKHFWLPKEQQ